VFAVNEEPLLKIWLVLNNPYNVFFINGYITLLKTELVSKN